MAREGRTIAAGRIGRRGGGVVLGCGVGFWDGDGDSLGVLFVWVRMLELIEMYNCFRV